ncbi:MAG: hypothetical protein V2I27_01415 [Erythrobacter sp.]|jgi:hypothetical protein|nr:hypothetical protein [Erythrobacter sp.]
MIQTISLMASALVLMQGAPGAPADQQGAARAPAITEFTQLPLEEATAARCGIAFAAIAQWQAADDPRGAPWPEMEGAGAREYFVQAMAQIMDKHSLGRDDVSRLVQREFQKHLADDGAAIAAMMPGCLLALDAAKF